MSVPNNPPSGPVYEDFRQLLALSEGRAPRNPRLIQRLGLAISRGLEWMAAMLETRVAVIIGCFLCFGLLGISWLEIRERGESQARAVVAAQAPTPATIAFETPSQVVAPALPEEAYVVRVGSFRDPANAARMADSLRDRMPNVITETRGGGLHVVEVGPFLQKSAAEDSARSLRQGSGLSPQVFRQK